jgi:hypothetical protein
MFIRKRYFMLGTSNERDIVRILFIIYFCGQVQNPTLFDEYTYTHVIDSETRLQKIDFWLRYPDHFANALLQEYQKNDQFRTRVQEIKQTVRSVFADQEPILRLIPMQKYLRGAYEPRDDVMTFLISRSLAVQRGGYQKQYFLTSKGKSVVERILQECSESQWYASRCKLIQKFFGNLNGHYLRNLQYSEEVYKTAKLLETISPIESTVRERFANIFGEEL